MSEEHKSLKQIIDYRIEKLFKLKEAGVELYPQKFTPNHFSQNIMLKLIDKGVSREDAYKIVQESAMKTWNSIRTNKKKSFLSFLLSNKNATSKIKKQEIKKIFNNKLYVKNINHIFRNVFKA